MGFGISNIINKYIRPALISWEDQIDANTLQVFPAGSINVDVKVSENHRFQNTVTEQTMEDGSVIDEHVINTPVEITLQFEETNNTPIAGGFLGSAAAAVPWLKFGPTSTFEMLKSLAEKRIPLTITTQHTIYDNMVIKNMPILHRAPYRNAIQVSCDLVQLNFAKVQTFSYKAGAIGTLKSAMGNISSGRVNTSLFGG